MTAFLTTCFVYMHYLLLEISFLLGHIYSILSETGIQ